MSDIQIPPAYMEQIGERRTVLGKARGLANRVVELGLGDIKRAPKITNGGSCNKSNMKGALAMASPWCNKIRICSEFLENDSYCCVDNLEASALCCPTFSGKIVTDDLATIIVTSHELAHVANTRGVHGILWKRKMNEIFWGLVHDILKIENLVASSSFSKISDESFRDKYYDKINKSLRTYVIHPFWEI